ncbi:MAG: hypothetical protein HZB38_15570 [Planctomycetes bacterium]|nr:hypothetical protein [Planctomycetota bacterium]
MKNAHPFGHAMTLLSVRFVVATLCLTSLAASSPARAQGVRPRSTSELLIDSARDVLVSKRAAPSAADLAHARALLGAAQRLDPASVDAAAFRFELESLAGDVDAANEALDRLIEVDPDNDVAQARRLARGPVGAQSRESAQKWYENALEKAPTPVARALAHVKLAELAIERLDRDAARKHAEEARTLCPDCAEPAAVLLDLLPADAAPVERIAAILAVLRTNPLAVEAAWQAAFLLDDLGLFADAEPFYGHAFRAHAYKTAGPPPLNCLLRAAENAYLRGQTGQAGAILTTALAGEPPEDWARLLRLGWLSEACGMRDRGRMLMKRLAENAARCSVVPDNATPENDAYAAWYYAFVERSGEKALPLAESAVRRAPDNTVAIRALGWAQSMVGKTDEARSTLASIAARDAASAARLASMLRDAC